jgi:hypothetical protein
MEWLNEFWADCMEIGSTPCVQRSSGGFALGESELRAAARGVNSASWSSPPNKLWQTSHVPLAGSSSRLCVDDSPAPAWLVVCGCIVSECRTAGAVVTSRMLIGRPSAETRSSRTCVGPSLCGALRPQRKAAGSHVGQTGGAGRRPCGPHGAHNDNYSETCHIPALGVRAPHRARSVLLRCV